MPRSRRRAGNFSFDLPKQSRKKRKGSASNYKLPVEARQAQKDKAYVAFQVTPRLNAVTQALHDHKGQCDVIFGGRKLWLKKENPKRPGKFMSFPIIVDGRRCPNSSIFSMCEHGRTSRRCESHAFSDFWIKVDPLATS